MTTSVLITLGYLAADLSLIAVGYLLGRRSARRPKIAVIHLDVGRILQPPDPRARVPFVPGPRKTGLN